MDTIIPEDISYLNFLNDKSHGLLLQNGQDSFEIQDSGTLNVEPIFTELVEGNTTWTLGGVPVYLNTPILAGEEQENAATATVIETDKAETTDLNNFPLEIPGKGFLTSSGLFFSNDVLLQLNLNEGQKSEHHNSVEILAQHIFKKNDATVNNTKHIEVKPPKEIELFFDTSDSETESNNFVDINDLIEIISVHKCKNCSALFERYDEIVEHIQKSCQSKIEAKANELCSSAKVQKMSSLLRTDSNKMPIVKDIYLCSMCENVGYESLENLRKHMLAKHNFTNNGNNKETAKDDNAKLKNNRSFFQNIINKQQAEGKKVKCLIKGCDSRFSRLEYMMRHHECHVNGEKKKFKCPECDKQFFIWRLCSTHLWKCHKIDVGLYTCTVCNSFKTLSPNNLLKHMTVHDTTKPFKPFLCAECGKEFKLLSQLKNHEAIHRPANEAAKFVPSKKTCNICNKVFSNTKILKKHIQAVHHKYKPFICNICGHQCARKAMLDLHLRQHTGEKPYKCDFCEYKTGDHNSLRRHLNRHYGFTKYSCPHCDYQTIQSIAYKMHIKKKHPGKDGFFSCVLCSFDTVNEQLYQDHIKDHSIGLVNGVPMEIETVHKNEGVNGANNATRKTVPNVDDEETQPGLFSSDHLDDMTIDTGGITIPAGSEMHV